jgi:cytochrome c553
MAKPGLALGGFVVAIFLASVSQAGGGDPVAGKEKSGLCQTCHGKDGMSVSLKCPNLAGQYQEYIIKQLRDIRKHARNDPTMSPMAATIANEKDMADIAAFFASQKKMQGAPTSNEAGRKLFLEGNAERGVTACISCHGEEGKGMDNGPMFFPVIGGQKKRYLVKQLKDLRHGRRQNDPAGMMQEVAKYLSDEEIEAVAEYLSGR